MDGAADEKVMRLRYAGTCRVCGADLPQRAEAVYERQTRTVRCVSHAPQEPVGPEAGTGEPASAPVAVETGTAGASARREYERRRAKGEARVRAEHPRLAGLILALGEERQSTKAWNAGAAGEERLGRGLDKLASDTVRLLHDRRIPGRGRTSTTSR